jgi:hypothetical protein
MLVDILIGFGLLTAGSLGTLAWIYLIERRNHADDYDARTTASLDEAGLRNSPRTSVIHDFTERAR